MTQTILHSSRSDEWYTPSYIIQLTTKVLGSIDLDPASCEIANQIVKASRYIDKEEDGLTTSWGNLPVSLFLNPPSGKQEGKSLLKDFWERLLLHRSTGMIEHAIFMGFSLEQLQTTQSCSTPIAAFPICIPSKRVKFVSPSGDFNNPTHGQVIAYLPGLTNKTSLFYETFGELGICLSPR